MFFPRLFLCALALGATALRAEDTPAPGPSPVEAASPGTTVAPTASPTPAVSPTPTPAASPMTSPRVLYPSNTAANVLNPRPGNETAATANLATTFLVLLGLCAGGYYLLRRQPGLVGGFKGAARKLNVSESRSLGNRQFLVVVEYESERMLLGVTPGKIDYLCPLRGPQGEPVFPSPKE